MTARFGQRSYWDVTSLVLLYNVHSTVGWSRHLLLSCSSHIISCNANRLLCTFRQSGVSADEMNMILYQHCFSFTDLSSSNDQLLIVWVQLVTTFSYTAQLWTLQSTDSRGWLTSHLQPSLWEDKCVWGVHTADELNVQKTLLTMTHSACPCYTHTQTRREER